MNLPTTLQAYTKGRYTSTFYIQITKVQSFFKYHYILQLFFHLPKKIFRQIIKSKHKTRLLKHAKAKQRKKKESFKLTRSNDPIFLLSNS